MTRFWRLNRYYTAHASLLSRSRQFSFLKRASRLFGMQISCAPLNFVAKTGAFARDSGILARLTS